MTSVAVIGAGTMGHGIAQVAALAGCDTRITDSKPEAVTAALARIKQNLDGAVQRGKQTTDQVKSALAKLSTSSTIQQAVEDADVVIEAVVEDLAVKQALLRDLDLLVGPDTILATNTSSISISGIASATAHPERVLGMHFFNPVHIMKLVEIVVHDTTDDAVATRATQLALDMGKQPIRVHDAPGFASTRLGVALGLEAMRMVEQGVATAEDIDRAMELGYGHPMGPLKVSDIVGLDIRLSIAESLHSQMNEPHFEPPTILRRMVQEGKLGKKSGEGFYDWE
ncbi:MAG: 3-hydroxyacyl-CoA dehydrogenase family protein [Gemmatimonadota bacterium]|nr:MAG: 3-hydroxyacyl-CoA dehydrogenase family protein [Gemmatimonadota bacterium]